MPIRPENRDRYPSDWPQISLAIRAERAGWRCECTGQCGREGETPWSRGRCGACQGQPHPITGSKVVLTVAHLDHQPENCDPANLLALCQRCHLSYDAAHHAANARRTRLAAQTAGTEPLFEEAADAAEPMPTGHATEIGSDSAAQLASWSCICGESGVIPYARPTGEPVALRLARALATLHEKETSHAQ